MIIATHQPIFLPWAGFFTKAMRADRMVLLDDVQFPRGRSWLNRNRLKNEGGELWLTVPVLKKGRGLQLIRDVEICDFRDWRKKHLLSMKQNYVHAPYFEQYFAPVETIYQRKHRFLVELNIDLIRFLWDALSVKTELLLQSDLGVRGTGTDLLVQICQHEGGDRLALFPFVEDHLHMARMTSGGIEPAYVHFRPPVYPQLWGTFIYNLSIMDLLLNCGPKSKDIVSSASTRDTP